MGRIKGGAVKSYKGKLYFSQKYAAMGGDFALMHKDALFLLHRISEFYRLLGNNPDNRPLNIVISLERSEETAGSAIKFKRCSLQEREGGDWQLRCLMTEIFGELWDKFEESIFVSGSGKWLKDLAESVAHNYSFIGKPQPIVDPHVLWIIDTFKFKYPVQTASYITKSFNDHFKLKKDVRDMRKLCKELGIKLKKGKEGRPKGS